MMMLERRRDSRGVSRWCRAEDWSSKAISSSRRDGAVRSCWCDRTLRRSIVAADALGDFDFVAYAQDGAGGTSAGVLAEDGFVCCIQSVSGDEAKAAGKWACLLGNFSFTRRSFAKRPYNCRFVAIMPPFVRSAFKLKQRTVRNRHLTETSCSRSVCERIASMLQPSSP